MRFGDHGRAGAAMSTRRRTRGQALAEFAIVIPIVLLLLMAIFDLGRAVFLYNGLTNAAREGARVAIVNQDATKVGERVAATTFGGPVSNLGETNLVRFYKSQPNADPLQNDPCSPIAIGCIAVVTPESDWSLITPILSSIIGPITFEARSELPIEFVCPNAAIPAYADSSLCPRQP
jgi:hypothetical protein